MALFPFPRVVGVLVAALCVATQARAQSVGDHRLLLAVFQFQNGPAVPASNYAALANAEAAYWTRMSYGNFRLTATTTPVIPLPIAYTCNDAAFESAALPALRAYGYVTSSYRVIDLLDPNGSNCGHSSAHLGGTVARVRRVSSLTHENSHLLGFNHDAGNGLSVWNWQSGVYTRLATPPVKDTWGDAIFANGIGAYDLRFTGWAPIPTINAPGQYVLEDVTLPIGGDLKGLRLSLNDLFAQPPPNWFSAYIQNVSGHVSVRAGVGDTQNVLVNGLDLDPSTTYRRSMVVGETICLRSQRTAKVTFLWLHSGKATLDIDPNAPDCVATAGGGGTPPPPSPTPTKEVCDGFDNNLDGRIDEGCTPVVLKGAA